VNIEKESFFGFLLNSIPNGILLLSGMGKVVFSNKSAKKILGTISSKSPIYSIIHVEGNIEWEGKIEDKYIYIKSIPCNEECYPIENIVIIKDITEYKNCEKRAKELKDTLDMTEDILNYAYEGIVLVNSDGKIVKMNYEKIMGIKEEDALGKPVEDVIENTRMHVVVKTGKEELCDIQRIQGHDMVTNRIPIIRDGKVIGAVGTVLFKDAKEVKELAKKLEVLESKLDNYRGEVERLQGARFSFDSIITRNKKMNRLKEIGRKASESNSTILITGESGTGKEMFAQAIHKASYRKLGSFIPINCAAIPRELLESELFGYEGGAFTGAKKEGKLGKLELANGGTAFLDEIGSMPMEMQAKLLRVLEEKEFERVGGTHKISLDVRIIAATNENLEEAISKGKFREDLYYRLNVINIEVPPLRDRVEDIPLLAEDILNSLIKELQTEYKTLHPETIEIFKRYYWPGNVREMRNIIERALNLSSGSIIYPKHLPEYLLQKVKYKITPGKEIAPLKDVVAEVEMQAIRNALIATQGNKTLAAEKLGIHRTALYKKMRKYDMDGCI